MSYVCKRVFRAIRLICAAAVAFCIALYFAAPLLFPLSAQPSGGTDRAKREYALYTPSSNATFVGKADFLDALLRVKGESAEWTESTAAEVRAAYERLKTHYSVRLTFTERIDGGTAYYCYAEKIGAAKAVCVNGFPVNLHVYIKDNGIKVGVPLIFGGY